MMDDTSLSQAHTVDSAPIGAVAQNS